MTHEAQPGEFGEARLGEHDAVGGEASHHQAPVVQVDHCFTRLQQRRQQLLHMQHWELWELTLFRKQQTQLNVCRRKGSN